MRMVGFVLGVDHAVDMLPERRRSLRAETGPVSKTPVVFPPSARSAAKKAARVAGWRVWPTVAGSQSR